MLRLPNLDLRQVRLGHPHLCAGGDEVGFGEDFVAMAGDFDEADRAEVGEGGAFFADESEAFGFFLLFSLALGHLLFFGRRVDEAAAHRSMRPDFEHETECEWTKHEHGERAADAGGGVVSPEADDACDGDDGGGDAQHATTGDEEFNDEDDGGDGEERDAPDQKWVHVGL